MRWEGRPGKTRIAEIVLPAVIQDLPSALGERDCRITLDDVTYRRRWSTRMSAFFEQARNWLFSESALFLWKTLAIVATAGFGVYGLDVKSRDDRGNFTRRGKVVLAGVLVSALITGLIQAGEYIQSQQQAADELARSRQILVSVERNLYPLEPLSMSFDIEFRMSDPLIATYATRVQPLIVSDPRTKRLGGGTISDDLHEVKFLLRINSYPEAFQPGTEPNDGTAAASLLKDTTEFTFTSVVHPAEPPIQFLSCDPVMASAVVTRPVFGTISQKVDLLADYQRRVFIKRVVTKNLVRMDANTLAKGAIDLIGHNMSWGDNAGNPKGQLSRFALGFSFDYDVESLPPQRFISVPTNANDIGITTQIIGLDNPWRSK